MNLARKSLCQLSVLDNYKYSVVLLVGIKTMLSFDT